MRTNKTMQAMMNKYDSVMCKRNDHGAAYILVENIKIEGKVYKLTEKDEVMVMEWFDMVHKGSTKNITIDNFYWSQLIRRHTWTFDTYCGRQDEFNEQHVRDSIESYAICNDLYDRFRDEHIDKFYDDRHTNKVVKFKLPKRYYVPMSAQTYDAMKRLLRLSDDYAMYQQILEQLAMEFIMSGPMATIL